MFRNWRTHIQLTVVTSGIALVSVIIISVYALQPPQLTAFDHRQSQTHTALTPDPYTGWHQYSNVALGVALKYPPNWKLIDNCGDLVCYFELQLVAKTADIPVAVLDVFNQNIEQTATVSDAFYEQSVGSDASYVKTNNVLKGTAAAQYVFAHNGVVTKQYLFAVGGNTYSLRSTHEAAAIQQNATYQTDFNKFFNSVVLQLP